MDERQDGVPIVEAATRLGLTPETVRKRLQRGRLPGYKRGPVWYVLLADSPTGRQDEAAGPEQDTQAGQPQAGQDSPPGHLYDRLLTAKDAELARLVEQIGVKDEQLRQANVIIAQLTQRPPELAAPPGDRSLDATDLDEPPPVVAAVPGPRKPWWRWWG